MNTDVEIEVLRHGDIEVIGRIPGSSNQALLVRVKSGANEVLACYKAERGERQLWDFPDGLWRREIAAYELDCALSTGLVPATISRDDAPFGPGSLQLWVTESGDEHYFTLREKPELEQWLMALCAFDVVANNADRKSGHVIFDGHRCWAIDNGLSFHESDKLRTVIWDYATEPIEAKLLESLDRFASGDVGNLAQWLSASELALTQFRASELVHSGELPQPSEDREWPPYPWPLI